VSLPLTVLFGFLRGAPKARDIGTLTDWRVAWIASFFNGSLANELKGNGLFVWCVRGGQGPDPQ